MCEAVSAAFLLQDDGELSLEELRDWARERLAAYKVPRRVLFFSGEDLDQTASSKLRVAALRELATRRIESEQGSSA